MSSFLLTLFADLSNLRLAMKPNCGGIALILTVVLAASLLGAEPVGLAPEAGVLLLRNGHVIQGNITKAGDYYVVVLGDSGELRIPTADAECTAASLADIYHQKVQKLDGKLASYLNLAEWCLRQREPGWATQQWLAASKIDPKHPRVIAVERRLASVAEEMSRQPTAPPKASPVVPEVESPETALAELSPLAIERYSTVIQPMVLNRCGANQCHGSASKTDLALFRPATGQPLIKRFTDRNLQTLLKFVDREKPSDSPLLIMAQRRHGGMTSATFDKRSQSQVKDLREWLDLVAGISPATPANIPSPETMANTTMRTVQNTPIVDPAINPASAQDENPEELSELPHGDEHFLEVPATPDQETPAKRTKGTAKGSTQATKPKSSREPVPYAAGSKHSAADILTHGREKKPVEKAFTPKDPFDPEIFNRRFHGEKPVAPPKPQEG